MFRITVHHKHLSSWLSIQRLNINLLLCTCSMRIWHDMLFWSLHEFPYNKYMINLCICYICVYMHMSIWGRVVFVLWSASRRVASCRISVVSMWPESAIPCVQYCTPALKCTYYHTKLVNEDCLSLNKSHFEQSAALRQVKHRITQ